MRFLVDAQLPMVLCQWLEAQGYEARYVGVEVPGEAPDSAVAAYAAAHECVLVTKDEDFLSRHPPIDYALVWLRLGNASNRALIEWLEPRWNRIAAKLEDGERLIEVR